ncbi:hypothetical protein Taro_040943 [Colocasia esculenta]|uniref:Uncharacterized protein n=1 Tax=Colocasia esculenta TaxID=4460 RepID=A0A843WRX8_COLES|nr:hypothetical protein [Colocasia esculenta]
MVTSPVGCPRFFVSQAVSSGLCPGTCVVPSRSVSSDLDTLTPVFELYIRLRERRQWDSDCCTCLLVTCSALIVGGTDTSSRHWSPASPFQCLTLEGPGQGLQRCQAWACDRVVRRWCRQTFPTEPVTSEAHPYPLRLRPVRGRRTRIKYVICLTGLAEAFRHSWYQSKKFEMADRRDWGSGGDDPEESTQRMIERIWESLTDIQRRMDQQAPVPPVVVPPGDGETIHVAPVPPGVEVPFVAPLPPLVLTAEEPVMQVEKFLRL